MNKHKHTPGPWEVIDCAQQHTTLIAKTMSGLVKYADWIIGGTVLAGWLVIVVVMVLS